MKFLSIVAGVILLVACSGQAIEPAKTFNERADYVLTIMDGILQTAVAERKAGTLSAEDAARIARAAQNIKNGLHRAKDLYALSQSAACIGATGDKALACQNNADAALGGLQTAQSLLLQLQHQVDKGGTP